MGVRRLLQDLPFRHKLRVIILIISGVSVAGSCALFVAYQWFSSRDQRARRLKVTSEVVGSQLVAAVEFAQDEEAGRILRSMRADPQVVAAAVYARDGSLFAKFVRDGAEEALVPRGPEVDGTRFEGGHLVLFHPLQSDGTRAGTIHFRIDLSDLRQQVWTNIAVVGVLLLAATGAILYLSGLLGRIITEPVRRLSEVVQSVGARRDYSVRVEGGGSDELGRLIEGFNDMLRQVEERSSALAKARDELEVRVKERTRDLEQEIAERRSAEKRLQEKEVRLTEAHEIAQLGSWEWNPSTNQVVWSDELYRITGVLPTKFKGALPDAVMVNHPDDRHAVQEALEKSRERREPLSLDTRIIRPDGSIRHLHVQGKPVLDDAGRVLRLVGTVQDITERKRSDEAIQALNQELRARMDEVAAVNKELEGFSYSVSHDLRAPLRAIDGYSRMLIEDYAQNVDGEGRRYLDVISANTKRMGQLIDDLLEFSRLGRKALLMSPVDLQELVKLVCDEARAMAPDRSIEFRIGTLPPARGDASMLRVVMTNLVSNAVKYSKGRDPAVVEIDGRADESETVYTVRDNGVGFEMEYAHKLFGVFQRLHAAHEFEGTGVGLALVQRIVQRHGGRVWAQSKVGAGAVFSFTLPRRAVPEAADGAAGRVGTS